MQRWSKTHPALSSSLYFIEALQEQLFAGLISSREGTHVDRSRSGSTSQVDALSMRKIVQCQWCIFALWRSWGMAKSRPLVHSWGLCYIIAGSISADSHSSEPEDIAILPIGTVNQCTVQTKYKVHAFTLHTCKHALTWEKIDHLSGTLVNTQVQILFGQSTHCNMTSQLQRTWLQSIWKVTSTHAGIHCISFLSSSPLLYASAIQL